VSPWVRGHIVMSSVTVIMLDDDGGGGGCGGILLSRGQSGDYRRSGR